MACQGHATSTATDDGAEDASVPRFGRADVARASRATAVALEVTGLGAWNQGDSLQLVSPETGAALAGVEAELAVYPSRGSTTITGQTVDWSRLQAPLVDAGKGDTTYVTQLIQHDGYASLGRAGRATGFTVRDGAAATLRAQLAPVAQDRKLDLHWKGSAFAQLAAQAGPDARPAAMAAIHVSALPEPISHTNNFYATHYMGLPDLAVVGPQLASADAELALAYGNPFTGWTELVSVVYTMTVPVVTAAGASSLPARVVAALPASELARSGIIAPAISPVQHVAVADGVVRWDAPALGRATDYRVEIRSVEARPLGVELPIVTTLHTQAPQVALPPDLVKGKPYVLTITAIATPGARTTLPYASADYVTAQITL